MIAKNNYFVNKNQRGSYSVYTNGLCILSAISLFSSKIPAVALALRAWRQNGKKERGLGENNPVP